ncbi:MAG: PEP-CTERM sorting domain-containing protein [Phycisphaeraceae bacterium]
MTAPCKAGWISEISLALRPVANTAGATSHLPAYVELSGLAPTDAVELVLIEARNSPRYGRVLQVIMVPAGHSVRVAADGPWPTDILPGVSTTPPGLHQLPGTEQLDLADRRSLVLFNQVSGLVVGATIQFQQVLSGTALLDVVTFGPGADARAYQSEPVLDSSAGTVIARPNVSPAQPWNGLYLVASPDPYNVMTAFRPVYVVNPGWLNPVWDPNPEPASLALLVGTGMLTIRRHRRR